MHVCICKEETRRNILLERLLADSKRLAIIISLNAIEELAIEARHTYTDDAYSLRQGLRIISWTHLKELVE